MRGNFSFTLLGSIIYNGCQWAMVAVVTKFGSDIDLTHLIGALAISGPVITFFNLQMTPIQALDATSENSFADFLFLRLISQVASLTLLASFWFIADLSINAFSFLILVGLNRAIYSIGESFYGEQQKNERMGACGMSLGLKGIVSICVMLTLLTNNSTVFTALVGWGVSHLILLGFDILYTKPLLPSLRDMLPISSLKSIIKLARKGLPLGVSALLISIQINIPNYSLMISEHGNDVGVFGSILFLATIGRKIIEAVVRAIGPRLSRLIHEGNITRYISLRRLMVLFSGSIGIAALIVSYACGELLLKYLYTDHFVIYLPVLLWILAGETANFISLALEHALIARKMFRAQLISISFSVTALTIASFLLVPSHGINGAAWAVTAGGLARMLASISITLFTDNEQNTRSLA
jgi:O-antigen/teichoic acid export membrane protein